MRYDRKGFVPEGFQTLSPRERDCLEMTSLGMLPAEIARRFDLDEAAVEDLLEQASAKLGAQNRFMAVVRAIALGLHDKGPEDPG